MQSHISGLSFYPKNRIYVISVIRFKQNHLVSRIKQREASAVERSRGASTNNNVGLWIGLYCVKAGQLFGYCFTQLRKAVESRVTVHSFFYSATRLLSHGKRKWRVAHALRQIDAAHFLALDG